MKDQLIHQTTDYNKFKISKENRDIDLGKSTSKKLRKSLRNYGWLPAFPMMVRKSGKELIIIDGQHRFSIAREVGLPVRYVIDNTDVDIYEINEAQKSWSITDYLNRWQKEGLKDYFEVEQFSKRNNIPVTISAAILCNTNSFGNVSDRFRGGTYKVKSRELAHAIANQYNKITEISSDVKSTNFIKALYACNYVNDFKPKRLIESARSNSRLLHSYGKIDEYLDMIEEIYNFGRKSKRIPLAFYAKEAMKDRSPTR